MDFRAVLILLCVLFTQAPCRPTGSGDDNISLARKEIRTAWGHLDKALTGRPCPPLNVTEHVGLKQQPLSANLHCYMQELSKLTPEVSKNLGTAAQHFKDMSNSTTPSSCSLPESKDLHDYELVQCFLELVLEGRPSNL